MGEYRIDVKISAESELYHPLDPNRTTLSDEVVDYIQNKFQDRPLGENIKLTIISEKPLDEAHVRTVMNLWIKKEEERNQRERSSNIYQMLRLLVIGAAIIAVSIAIELKIHAVWYTIISTIGAFSVWEAANIIIIKNPKLKLDKRVIRRLSEKVEVSFQYKAAS